MTTTSPKIASSVDITKPTDELSSSDAYGDTPDQVRSSLDINWSGLIQSVVPAINQEIYGGTVDKKELALGIGAGINNNTKLVDVPLKSDTQTVNAEESSDKTIALSENDVRLLKKAADYNLSDADVNTAAGYLLRLNSDRENSGDGAILDDSGTEVLKIARDVDPTSAVSISNGLGNWSKSENFKTLADENPSLAVGMTWLDKAAKAGIPQLIDNAMAKLEQDKLSKEMARRRLIDSTRSILQRGDIKGALKVREYIGINGILTRSPDAIHQMVSNYRLPSEYSRDNLAPANSELLEFLESISQTWYSTERSSGSVGNLYIFNDVSQDAYDVLSYSDSDYTTSLIIGRSHRTRTNKSLLSSTFPILA